MSPMNALPLEATEAPVHPQLAALVRKYDGPGPRYTSYPTALQFTPSFDAEAHAAAVRAVDADAARALSLYLHVPFCASPCFYCGCTKIVTRRPGTGADYLGLLEREIALQAALFRQPRRVEQLHIGGGTPTYLDLSQFERLFASLHRHFALADDDTREFSIEIDPRTIEPRMLAALSRLGFNRASFGIQDFDPAVQQAVNREQTPAQVARLMDAARAAGFGSLSADLIYGLPRQTARGFAATLEAVLRLQPDRISAYSYAHVPARFKAQQRIRLSELPNAAQKLELLQLTIDTLEAAGYAYIGMDHFARPDDALTKALQAGTLQRNFQGYSTRGDLDLLGLGMSAISRLGDRYSQNSRTLADYRAAVLAGRLPVERGLELNADDCLRRDVIAALMCEGRLDYAQIAARHGIDPRERFAAALGRLHSHAADGLLRLHEQGLEVTRLGRYLLRAIAMPFDAYLAEAPAQRYSRVV